MWNQLPVSVRHSTSISSFKSSVETSFQNLFQSHCLDTRLCVGGWGGGVGVRAYVRACVRTYLSVCLCLRESKQPEISNLKRFSVSSRLHFYIKEGQR